MATSQPSMFHCGSTCVAKQLHSLSALLVYCGSVIVYICMIITPCVLS